MSFDPDYPILIAFAGKAGSGKTSTANAIVPTVQSSFYENKAPIIWDHTFFAAPLYDMVAVKTELEGDEGLADRILYSLHDIVYDILQRDCSFEDLIELVYDLYHMPCEYDMDDKARTFMQQAGDLCRALNEDCLASAAVRKVNSIFNNLKMEYDRGGEDEPPIYLSIISDLRMKNELELIRSQPNNLLVKFKADDNQRAERLSERSGRNMTPEQLNHKSETELDAISDEEYDIILDTSNYTLAEQATVLKENIISTFKD